MARKKLRPKKTARRKVLDAYLKENNIKTKMIRMSIINS